MGLKRRNWNERRLLDAVEAHWLDALTKLSIGNEIPFLGGTAESRILANKGVFVDGGKLKPDITLSCCSRMTYYDLTSNQKAAYLIMKALTKNERIAFSIWPFYKNKTKPKTHNRYRRADIPTIARDLFLLDWTLSDYDHLKNSADSKVIEIALQASEKVKNIFGIVLTKQNKGLELRHG